MNGFLHPFRSHYAMPESSINQTTGSFKIPCDVIRILVGDGMDPQHLVSKNRLISFPLNTKGVEYIILDKIEVIFGLIINMVEGIETFCNMLCNFQAI
jgi:hypothetical protein